MSNFTRTDSMTLTESSKNVEVNNPTQVGVWVTVFSYTTAVGSSTQLVGGSAINGGGKLWLNLMNNAGTPAALPSNTQVEFVKQLVSGVIGARLSNGPLGKYAVMMDKNSVATFDIGEVINPGESLLIRVFQPAGTTAIVSGSNSQMAIDVRLLSNS